MSSLTKTVSHEYDPKIVYHSHSSNVPHLNSWIDELISFNENSLPKQSTPNTNNLVEALQRYDSVFKELLRQTSIFSDPITKMMSKVWAGNLKLMDYMIKSYHRYVKHTSHLQSQAQTLLNERQRGEAANKIQKEEFDLERAHLRARIRNLESEVDSMRTSKRGLENENNKLRRIIDVYIKSSELSDPVWDVMNEDDHLEGGGDQQRHRRGNAQAQRAADGSSVDVSKTKSFRRKDSVDTGRMQLKTLNRLDIELNEILANVLKEENRQRLLMSDVMKLIERNKDIFTSDNRVGADGDDNLQSDSASASTTGGSFLPPTIGKMSSVRSLHSKRSSLDGVAEHLQRRSVGIQIDDKDRYGAVEDTEQHVIEHLHLGVAPLAPLNVMSPGADQPYQLRSYMTSFPKVLRVPPAAWACQMIMSIYMDKIQADEERLRKGRQKLPMPVHMYNYFKQTLGLALAADIQVAQLLKACESHVRKQPRVALFASQVGLFDKDELPPMDVRDTDFVLHVLGVLMKLGEIGSVPDKKKAHAKLGESLRPDVTRAGALQTVHDIFEKWLPDGGEDYLMKVRAMPHSDKGSRFVDLDEFVEILIEPWNNVRSNWEEHARYLFHDHSSVHRILQEATFANDDGTQSSDTILVEVHKASASDCIRRPLRLFQKSEAIDAEFGERGGGNPVGNPNKESVCEVIDFKKFMDALLSINPTLPMTEIESMFEEALDHAHERVLRALEHMWMRCVDNYSHGGHRAHSVVVAADDGGSSEQTATVSATSFSPSKGTNKEFWVNMRNSISQWTRPYTPNVFRAQDIEIDSFVSVLIRRDVFPKSPLVELLNIPPKDLWSNSDMFYKQVFAERARKDKLLVPAESVSPSGSVTAPTASNVSRHESTTPVAKSHHKKGKGGGTVGKAHRVAVSSTANSPLSVNSKHDE